MWYYFEEIMSETIIIRERFPNHAYLCHRGIVYYVHPVYHSFALVSSPRFTCSYTFMLRVLFLYWLLEGEVELCSLCTKKHNNSKNTKSFMSTLLCRGFLNYVHSIFHWYTSYIVHLILCRIKRNIVNNFNATWA